MKKQPTLSSRLKQYSTFAAVVAASSAAHAQIIYTDLVPDVVIDVNNPVYELDLNNDGYTDFYIELDTSGINPNGSNGQLLFYMTIRNPFLYGGSRVLVNPGGGGGQIKKLSYGYPINGQAEKWMGRGPLAYGLLNGYSYSWAETEAYVGLKFQDLDGIHTAIRGWVRLEVHTDNPGNLSIIVKDYAYNSISGHTILAGEGANVCTDSYEPNNNFSEATPISLGQPILSMINSASDKDFYQFNVAADQPNIRLELLNLPKNYDMKLYDATKQLIETAKNKQKENDTIIYNNAAPGIYYVKVYQKDNTFDAENCYSLIAQTSSSPFKVSSDQLVMFHEINLFPNPASDILTVQFDDELKANTLVYAFDLEGRQVMTSILQSGEVSSQLNISSLTSGMYLLKAVAGNQVMMQKFSVVK